MLLPEPTKLLFSSPLGIVEQSEIRLPDSTIEYGCKGMDRKVQHAMPLSHELCDSILDFLTIGLVPMAEDARTNGRVEPASDPREDTRVGSRTIEIHHESRHPPGDERCSEPSGQRARQV